MQNLFRFAQNYKRLIMYIRLFTRGLNFRKIINVFKVEASRIFKSEYVKGMPYLFVIDPTNVCNLRCPLCLTGAGTSNRQKGKIGFELYKDVIDQIAHYALHIFLYNWGEPLLLKNIAQLIRYAKSKGISVSISSNLSINLDRLQVEALIRSGLDRLIVSCDGCNQNTYEKYRYGGNFKKVLDNMRLLLEVQRQLKSKKPYIEWQYLLTSKNENFVREARFISKKIGIKFFSICSLIIPFGWPKEKFMHWLPSTVRASEYPNLSLHDICDPCRWLWRSMVVNWDGTVSPCCYLGDKYTDFGDLKKDSLFDIWNGSWYRTARRLFKERKMQPIVCSQCSVFKYCCSKKP